MNKRSNPQNALLKLLNRHKTVSIEHLKEQAEIELETVSEAPETFEKDTKSQYAVARAMKNILESGFAETIPVDDEQAVRLTPAGRKKLASIELTSGTLPLPATWDGRWRMVILDLPEDRKSEREALRYLLKKAGFACVKNTVWVSPYPFEHLFINLKKDLGLSTEMIVLTTDTIDEETEQKFLNQK